MKLIVALLPICLFASALSLDSILRHNAWNKEKSITERSVRKDEPLDVLVTQIGDRYAVFNITGSDTVSGSPVTGLVVNYTLNGPKAEVKSQTLTTCNTNGRLNQIVKLEDLDPGQLYKLQFSAENAQKQVGPPSAWVPVLLLPPTPDITVDHPSLHKLKIKWGEKRSKSEDYYLLTVEKKSALGCGLTVNLTSCYGNKYTLDDLEVGQVYRLTMRAHNPTGFSDPVVVSYPID